MLAAQVDVGGAALPPAPVGANQLQLTQATVSCCCVCSCCSWRALPRNATAVSHSCGGRKGPAQEGGAAQIRDVEPAPRHAWRRRRAAAPAEANTQGTALCRRTMMCSSLNTPMTGRSKTRWTNRMMPWRTFLAGRRAGGAARRACVSGGWSPARAATTHACGRAACCAASASSMAVQAAAAACPPHHSSGWRALTWAAAGTAGGRGAAGWEARSSRMPSTPSWCFAACLGLQWRTARRGTGQGDAGEGEGGALSAWQRWRRSRRRKVLGAGS